MSAAAPASTSTPSATTRRLTRLAVAAGGVLVAVVVWAIAGPVLGADLTATRNGQSAEIGPPEIIVNAAIGAALGWILLAILERFTKRPRRIWLTTTVILLVLSLGTPFSADMTTGTRATLLILHLAVAAVVLPGFARTSR